MQLHESVTKLLHAPFVQSPNPLSNPPDLRNLRRCGQGCSGSADRTGPRATRCDRGAAAAGTARRTGSVHARHDVPASLRELPVGGLEQVLRMPPNAEVPRCRPSLRFQEIKEQRQLLQRWQSGLVAGGAGAGDESDYEEDEGREADQGGPGVELHEASGARSSQAALEGGAGFPANTVMRPTDHADYYGRGWWPRGHHTSARTGSSAAGEGSSNNNEGSEGGGSTDEAAVAESAGQASAAAEAADSEDACALPPAPAAPQRGALPAVQVGRTRRQREKSEERGKPCTVMHFMRCCVQDTRPCPLQVICTLHHHCPT